MRLFYTCALAALSVSSAPAQTQYADSTGGYAVLHELAFGGNESGWSWRGADATVGYRFDGGLDVGVRAARTSFGLGTTTRLGPTVGLSRPFGGGFVGRVEAAVLASHTTGNSRAFLSDGTLSTASFDVRGWTTDEDVTATVSRPVRLIGSVRLRPTVGLYAAAQQSRFTYADAPAGTDRAASTAAAGIHVELPLSFRLFGQDVALAPAIRFPLGDGFRFALTNGAYAGGGLRLNF